MLLTVADEAELRGKAKEMALGKTEGIALGEARCEVREQITLMNSGDITNAKRGIIQEADIHTITVEALWTPAQCA